MPTAGAMQLVCLFVASLFKTLSKHTCGLWLLCGWAICITLDQGQLTFSVKSQIANSLDFASHMASVTTTQFCSCGGKRATDSA